MLSKINILLTEREHFTKELPTVQHSFTLYYIIYIDNSNISCILRSMKRIHQAHVHGDETEQKRLILSVCRHGVSDSWATKQLLEEHLQISRNFTIEARGVDPAGIQETPEGTRGIELTIDDIRKSCLLLIHDSNVHYFRQRFGQEFLTALHTEGYLLIRNGRECQHTTKNTQHPNRHIADCCKIFADSLQLSLRRRAASEMVYDEAFAHAEKADERWQSQKYQQKDSKKTQRKHQKTKR